MGNMEIQSRISFIPLRQPCSNIRIVASNIGYPYFEYDKAKESYGPIDTNTMEHFCNDTLKLLKLCSRGHILVPSTTSSSDDESLKKILDAVSAYMNLWGELIPKPKRGSKILPWELFELGSWYLFVKSFWNSPENGDLVEAVAKILNHCEWFDKLEDEQKKEEHRVKYWLVDTYPRPDRDEEVIVTVYPLRENPLKEIIVEYNNQIHIVAGGGFKVIVKSPTPGKLSEINSSKQNKIDWIQEIVMKNITDYLERNPLKLSTSMKGSTMQLSGTTNNLFLAFVMNDLLQINKRKISPCVCGCGRLPSGRKSYFSDKCRENMPARKIAHWLKMRKGRDQLSNEKYLELMEPVNDELNDGKTEEEIRERIILELRRGGNQLPSQLSIRNKA